MCRGDAPLSLGPWHQSMLDDLAWPNELLPVPQPVFASKVQAEGHSGLLPGSHHPHCLKACDQGPQGSCSQASQHQPRRLQAEGEAGQEEVQRQADKVLLKLFTAALKASRVPRALGLAGRIVSQDLLEGALKLASHFRCAAACRASLAAMQASRVQCLVFRLNPKSCVQFLLRTCNMGQATGTAHAWWCLRGVWRASLETTAQSTMSGWQAAHGHGLQRVLACPFHQRKKCAV